MKRGPALLVSLFVSGCIRPFPEMPPPDYDGDGFVDAEYGGDDCDDADTGAHPDVDECKRVEEQSRDDDCDGLQDGGSLPWFEPFDGDALDPGWLQPQGVILNQVEDGYLLQAMDETSLILRGNGAECWTDVALRARFLTGWTDTFDIHVFTRATVHYSDDDYIVLGYELNLANSNGYYGPYLERTTNSETGKVELLETSTSEKLEVGDVYLLEISVVEDGGTRLSCSYDLEDGTGPKPCWQQDEGSYLDTDAVRPLTGGIGFTLGAVNFYEDTTPPYGQPGLAIDCVELHDYGSAVPWTCGEG